MSGQMRATICAADSHNERLWNGIEAPVLKLPVYVPVQ